MSSAISGTDYNFPGQTGIYKGKVRDVYTINDKYLVMIASDRISAFDIILPRAIPYKGQVLNQIATHFLQKTKDIAPNWLVETPDPNASIGFKCEPFKIEMVVRGMLVGHAWREYKAGKREICGQSMPEGLKEYDLFPKPLITPSTKAEVGHDEDITPEDIVKLGLASQAQFDELSDLTLKLFAHGQSTAKSRGLILADTKYEFGLLNGKIMLIDEVHTPDSSRYFYADSHDQYLKDRTLETPKNLSKEFVRSWLMDKGFSGKDGEQMPDLSEEFITSISERYIELFEQITGEKFIKDESPDIIKRIETNVVPAIGKLK